MADIKISDLPDAGDIQTGDTIPIVRGGVTLRTTSDPTISASLMSGNAGKMLVITAGEDDLEVGPFPGGQVDSLVAGTDIGIDATDPVNPIVNFTGAPAVDTNQVSYTWNRSGNTSVGNMLMIGDLDEMLLAYDVELIAMSILRTDTDAATLEVLNNGSPIKTLATSALAVVDNFAGIACSALDIISVRNQAGGSTVSDCGVTLTFQRT